VVEQRLEVRIIRTVAIRIAWLAEFTANHAERMHRPAVQCRKKSLGKRGADSCNGCSVLSKPAG